MQWGFHPYASYKSYKTGSSPYGRVHRHAVLGSNNDLKAARPFGVLKSINSHFFCFLCKVWHRAQMGRTDCHRWEKADDCFLKTGAEMWRKANRLVDQTIPEVWFGTQDSEFWCLPYWSPICQLLIDPMHTMYLLVMKHFFRDILGLDNPQAGKTCPSKPSLPCAFYYNFCPPPHPSLLPLPHSQDAVSEQQVPAPLSRNNSLSSIIALEKLPAE